MAAAWAELTGLAYVGERSAEKLYRHGFETKAAVCAADEDVLVHILGPNGYRVARENTVEGDDEEQEGLRDRLRAGVKRFRSVFGRGNLKIGIYGPPNAGKTSLANRIARDWTGEAVGIVSGIPHETQEVLTAEDIEIEGENGTIALDLMDTPGFSSSAYVEEMEEHGLSAEAIKEREKQVNEGVRHAIQLMDDIDIAIIVLDATRDNDEPDNLTLLGALERAGIPHLVVANKIDRADADSDQVRETYRGKDVVPVSAKEGDGMDLFYRAAVEVADGA